MLYIVPTPIGNLGDITLRAIATLKSCDLILTEDTRTSSILLRHYLIETPMRSFHAFNEHKTVTSIIDLLHSGKTISLISDAGTPGISDPGFLLVRECIHAGIKISCLPGATALIPAAIASGMPTDKFFFEGFLPHKKGRQSRWKFLATQEVTIILYESPHRLVKCLEEIRHFLGDSRKVCVAREISKKFEEFKTLPIDESIIYYKSHPPKGEIVIVVEGKKPEKSKNNQTNDFI